MPGDPVGQLGPSGSVLGAESPSIHPTRTWHMLHLSDMGMESMLVWRSGLLSLDARAVDSRAVDSCVVESSWNLH